jgi:hypothetical protein
MTVNSVEQPSRSRALGKQMYWMLHSLKQNHGHMETGAQNLKTAIRRSIDFEDCDACGTNWS